MAFGLVPGASGWATAPRVGVATALISLGVLLLAMPAVVWILRRTARPGDYAGACPVGATCPCGHFNFKPRRTCRSCGAATAFSERPA